MISGKIQKKINDNLLLVICTYLFVVILYGAWAFTDIVTFDAEGFYSQANGPKWYTQWLRLGRWGFVLLKKILGVTYINPFFSISVFLIFFPLSVLLWNYILVEWSGKNSKLASALFIGIYVTHPVWTLQFAYRNQIEVATITMVILPIGVLYFAKWIESKKLLYMFLAYFIITFSSGCYLPFLILYMQAALLFFFFYLEKAIRNDIPVLDYWKDVLKAFVFSIIVFASWLLISHIIVSANGLTFATEFYGEKVLWSTRPFSENVREVFDTFVSTLIGNKIYTAIYGIVSLFFIAWNILQMVIKKSYSFTRIILIILIEICPIMMHIASAGDVVDRTAFAYSLCIAALAWFDLIIIRDEFVKKRKTNIYAVLSLILAVFLIIPQMQRSTRLLWTDVRIMERDILKMNAIYYKAIDLGAKEGDAIFFWGIKWDMNDEANLKHEVVGISYFEIPQEWYNQKTIDAFQAYGYPLVAASQEQVEIAEEKYVKDMPCWPENGSIKVVDGLIIVKLSEIQ